MLSAMLCQDSPARAGQDFRLFTFLLDENGQLNYNIDITEPKAGVSPGDPRGGLAMLDSRCKRVD